MADTFEIRQIVQADRLTGLSLGHDKFTPLKTFLQKHAKKYEERSLARSYAAFSIEHAPKILGYVTLVCGEIVLEGEEESLIESDVSYRYKQYPAVKIARLAVDSRRRKLGLGRTLVELALGIAKGTVCPSVGCRFVVVDSKIDSTDFYSRCGFTMLDTEANRTREEPVMFVDLHKIPT